MDNTKENAICITKSGRIYPCSGVFDRVFPEYDLGNELKGAFVTHNHPISATHYSFSYDDICLFMEYDLEELTGVDEEYMYRIRRTNKTTRADYETLEHSYKGDNYIDFLQEMRTSGLDADVDEYDFYVRRLAREYGFEYERQKR